MIALDLPGFTVLTLYTTKAVHITGLTDTPQCTNGWIEQRSLMLSAWTRINTGTLPAQGRLRMTHLGQGEVMRQPKIHDAAMPIQTWAVKRILIRSALGSALPGATLRNGFRRAFHSSAQASFVGTPRYSFELARA